MLEVAKKEMAEFGCGSASASQQQHKVKEEEAAEAGGASTLASGRRLRRRTSASRRSLKKKPTDRDDHHPISRSINVVYTVAPRVVDVHPHDFMRVVQILTGGGDHPQPSGAAEKATPAGVDACTSANLPLLLENPFAAPDGIKPSTSAPANLSSLMLPEAPPTDGAHRRISVKTEVEDCDGNSQHQQRFHPLIAEEEGYGLIHRNRQSQRVQLIPAVDCPIRNPNPNPNPNPKCRRRGRKREGAGLDDDDDLVAAGIGDDNGVALNQEKKQGKDPSRSSTIGSSYRRRRRRRGKCRDSNGSSGSRNDNNGRWYADAAGETEIKLEAADAGDGKLVGAAGETTLSIKCNDNDRKSGILIRDEIRLAAAGAAAAAGVDVAEASNDSYYCSRGGGGGGGVGGGSSKCSENQILKEYSISADDYNNKDSFCSGNYSHNYDNYSCSCSGIADLHAAGNKGSASLSENLSSSANHDHYNRQLLLLPPPPPDAEDLWTMMTMTMMTMTGASTSSSISSSGDDPDVPWESFLLDT